MCLPAFLDRVDKLLATHAGVEGSADLAKKTEALLSLRQRWLEARMPEEDLPEELSQASIKKLMSATVGRLFD